MLKTFRITLVYLNLNLETNKSHHWNSFYGYTISKHMYFSLLNPIILRYEMSIMKLIMISSKLFAAFDFHRLYTSIGNLIFFPSSFWIFLKKNCKSFYLSFSCYRYPKWMTRKQNIKNIKYRLIQAKFVNVRIWN